MLTVQREARNVKVGDLVVLSLAALSRDVPKREVVGVARCGLTIAIELHNAGRYACQAQDRLTIAIPYGGPNR